MKRQASRVAVHAAALAAAALGVSAETVAVPEGCTAMATVHKSMCHATTLLDWGAHTVDLCQWANNADETMPIEYEPSQKNIICRYANGVKMVLDFLSFLNRVTQQWNELLA